MKKFLTPLLLLSLAVLFGMTWYCSLQAEKYFNAEVAAINRVLPAAIRLNVESYQRSLFTAEAETAVMISGRELTRLHHLIRHYVWGVDMFSTLAPGSALAEEIGQIVPLQPLQLKSHVSLQGQLTSDFDLAVSVKNGGKDFPQVFPYRLIWSGTGNFSAESFAGHLEFNRPLFAAGYRFYDKFRTGKNENIAVLNEQAEQLAGGLVQKGILTRESGNLSLNFLFSHGQKTLNGKPL